MSHGHDLKVVSADGKLLDYYKDILRYRAMTELFLVSVTFFQDSSTTTAMFCGTNRRCSYFKPVRERRLTAE